MWIDSELNAQIEEATRTYYTKDFMDNTRKQVYIPKENMYVCLEDLVSIIKHLKEEIKDIQKDIEDNYKPIDVSSQY